jgi:hypothetical protein
MKLPAGKKMKNEKVALVKIGVNKTAELAERRLLHELRRAARKLQRIDTDLVKGFKRQVVREEREGLFGRLS